MNVDKFQQLPLMGIIRGIPEDSLEPVLQCAVNAGLQTLEIAMNTDNAASLIKQARKIVGDKMCIGAGTVISRDLLDSALDSGATFVVLPTLVEEVVSFCVDKKIPVFPGAFTPQEIFNVWQSGATMVKVFPAKFFGPPYIREIKGPFDSCKLLACGGVRPDNISDFFSQGADAVAFGGSVFNKEWIASGEFDKIEHFISSYIQSYKSFQQSP